MNIYEEMRSAAQGYQNGLSGYNAAAVSMSKDCRTMLAQLQERKDELNKRIAHAENELSDVNDLIAKLEAQPIVDDAIVMLRRLRML